MATKSFGQVAFTPSQQAAKVRRVNSLARHDALLIRCDGTKGDLEGYRAGNTDTGWNCATLPRRDDLLIGVVGTGATRMIVSVCLVERVTRPGVAIWQEETDVSIKPAVAWRDVMRAAQQTLNAAELSLRAWPNVAGSRRGAVIDALCHCLENQTDSPEEEGKRQLRSCRSRSQLNRVKKLERSDGSCEVCACRYAPYSAREAIGAWTSTIASHWRSADRESSAPPLTTSWSCVPHAIVSCTPIRT